MTPQERVLLLQKLASPQGMPTAEARQAIDMLKGLYRYPPKVEPDMGGITIRNPVTGISADAITSGNYGDKTSVSFRTHDTYYDRPAQPRTRVQQAGIQATMGQLLDAIPSTRAQVNNLGAVPSQLWFEAITDRQDVLKSDLRGKPVNQRASLYSRNTRGALQAYPPKQGHVGLDWMGFTEKIGPTTWQPKDSKGRFMKYVQWDPKSSLNNLKRLAQGTKLVPGAGRFAQVLDGVMTADSIVEGVTGVSPTKEVMKGTVKTLANMYRTKPTTNIGPILPY